MAIKFPCPHNPSLHGNNFPHPHNPSLRGNNAVFRANAGGFARCAEAGRAVSKALQHSLHVAFYHNHWSAQLQVARGEGTYSSDVEAIEHVDHVLCGHIATGPLGIGTAPQPSC